MNGCLGYSTTYIWSLDIPFFDVTKCLPYDIMHTIFEGKNSFNSTQIYCFCSLGVAPRLLKELFVTFINIKKYFTLSELNQSLASHHYGYSELDTKPNTITGSTMEYHIKQKGECSYHFPHFCTMLTFIIKKHINHHYTQLLR